MNKNENEHDYKRRNYEQEQRTNLTDRIVKRSIYNAAKVKIKWEDITPEMIIERRELIMYKRFLKVVAPSKRVIAESHKCEICEKLLPVGRARYCSDECRKKKSSNRSFLINKSKKALVVCRCEMCDISFIPEYGDKRKKFCSDKCLAKYSKRSRNLRRYIDSDTMKGISYGAIFRRDQFICQICYKKVDMKLSVPHLFAATVDHIIPLSRGGNHEPSNLQLAHFICNSKKGSR